MKQNVNEKIKKYVERFDVILKRLNKIKRRDSDDELQNFIRNLRSNHQLELYKHSRHVNRQNLKTAVQRLENAKYYRNKHDKKNKKKNKKKKKNQDDQVMMSKTSSLIKSRKAIKKIKTTTTTISKERTLIIKDHSYIDELKKSMSFM